jgi:hypothetical protein
LKCSAARFALQLSAAALKILSAARFSAAGVLALQRFATAALRFATAALRFAAAALRFATAALRFAAAALPCSAEKHKRCSAALQGVG